MDPENQHSFENQKALRVHDGVYKGTAHLRGEGYGARGVFKVWKLSRNASHVGEECAGAGKRHVAIAGRSIRGSSRESEREEKVNAFDFGALPLRGGFIAFYRMVHRSENFVIRDGRHDVIFATRAEAEKAAGEAFKAYLNSPISGMTAEATSRTSAADAVFNLKPFAKNKARVKHKPGMTRLQRRAQK